LLDIFQLKCGAENKASGPARRQAALPLRVEKLGWAIRGATTQPRNCRALLNQI